MHPRLLRKNINWPLLAWHVLAIPFLILGAQQLQAIRWLAMAQVYHERGLAGFQQHYPTLDIPVWLGEMSMGPLYAWALAVGLGCLLSASIVWLRRESWAIPLLVLGVSVVSSWTHYYESAAVKSLLVWVRWPVEALSAESRLGFAGGILILTGLIIFLLTWRKVPSVE
jgi:hypothetical protein